MVSLKLYNIVFTPASSAGPDIHVSFYHVAESHTRAYAEVTSDLRYPAEAYWGDTPYAFSDDLTPNDEDDYWTGECYRTDLPFDHPDADDPPMICIGLIGDYANEPTADNGQTRFDVIMELQDLGYDANSREYRHFWDRNAFMEWAKTDYLYNLNWEVRNA